MKKFFPNRNALLDKRRWVIAALCIAAVIGVYYVLTRPEKPQPVYPSVVAAPAEMDDVELYGEYVGRIYMCANAAPQYVVREYLHHEEAAK